MIIIFEAPMMHCPGEGDIPSGYRAIRARVIPAEGSFIAIPGADDGEHHEVVEVTFAADLETVTVGLEGRRVRADYDRGECLPGWYATEAEALVALNTPPVGLAEFAAREALTLPKPPRPRLRLNWHHFPDADRSTIDARARLRFTPDPIEGDTWGKHRTTTTTMTIEVGTMPVRQEGEPDRKWSSFSARLGFDCRSGAGLARSEVLLDDPPDDPVDAIGHAIRMAEEWAASYVGPGWSPLTVDDARRSHPPPALPEPQRTAAGGLVVHFEDDAEPLRLVADIERSGLTWFVPGDPDHPGYESETEVIDGHRIERVEGVPR